MKCTSTSRMRLPAISAKAMAGLTAMGLLTLASMAALGQDVKGFNPIKIPCLGISDPNKKLACEEEEKKKQQQIQNKSAPSKMTPAQQEALRKAFEERAKKVAEEKERAKKAEEEKRKAEQEAAKKKAELEAARAKAEEAKRKAEQEAAKKKAEQEAAMKKAEEARLAAQSCKRVDGLENAFKKQLTGQAAQNYQKLVELKMEMARLKQYSEAFNKFCGQ